MMIVKNSNHVHGAKKPFKLEEIWGIRTRLQINDNPMQLALLNLAIDSKLRSCDLLRMKVGDVYSQGIVHPRVQLNQSKTGNDVQFEITPRSQQSISRWIFSARLGTESYLFPSLRRIGKPISYSYYSKIIKSWALSLGLDDNLYGTHSMRRTKTTLIYARTKNIRAVQLLLGHTKVDNTIRYLGIEIEDALKLSEETDS